MCSAIFSAVHLIFGWRISRDNCLCSFAAFGSLFISFYSDRLFPSGVAMVFSRSLTTFLRASRHIATPARGANPVNRVFGHDRFGARGYAAVFSREKPHVNVGESRYYSPLGFVADQYRNHWPRRSWQGKSFPSRMYVQKLIYLDYLNRRHHQTTSRTGLG